jgi:hypothetical protein
VALPAVTVPNGTTVPVGSAVAVGALVGAGDSELGGVGDAELGEVVLVLVLPVGFVGSAEEHPTSRYPHRARREATNRRRRPELDRDEIALFTRPSYPGSPWTASLHHRGRRRDVVGSVGAVCWRRCW